MTRTTSERFGAMTDHPVACDVEIRASWSPSGDLGPHLIAFGEVLCLAAGLPPIPPGVVQIPQAHGQPDGLADRTGAGIASRPQRTPVTRGSRSVSVVPAALETTSSEPPTSRARSRSSPRPT